MRLWQFKVFRDKVWKIVSLNSLQKLQLQSFFYHDVYTILQVFQGIRPFFVFALLII